MEKNKQNTNNKSMTILCTFLIIIIIGLVGFIGFTLGSKTTPLPQVEEKEESKAETNNEEVEFNDYKTIKEISTEIELILGGTSSFELSKTYGTYGFRSGVLKNELTKKDKQQIVLESVSWDNITGDAWKNYEKMKNIVEMMSGNDEQKQQEYLARSHQISAEKVNEQSIKLFGEIIENPIEEVGMCPHIYYDANSNTYFRPEPACGGTSAHYVKSYKSKFTTKNDEVYVYVNFAYIGPGTYNGSYEYYEVYKDIKDVNSLENSGNFIDKYTLEDPIYWEENFTVNERNYQHFSEYKFTFKKDKNDNYYFVDVKQTK